jgi:hypothetical protein
MSVATAASLDATRPGTADLAPGPADPGATTEEEDSDHENPYMDLKDMPEHMAPVGFRYSTRLDKIIPESYDSTSHSAREKIFYKHGRMVEPDDSDSSSSGESVGSEFPDHDDDNDDTQVSRKRNREDAEQQDEAEASPPEMPAYRTPCGRVQDSQWDGNAQCMCDVCLGYPDSQQSQGPDADCTPEVEYEFPKKRMREYNEFLETGKSTADWIAHLDAEKTDAEAAEAENKEKLEKYEAVVQELAKA